VGGQQDFELGTAFGTIVRPNVSVMRVTICWQIVSPRPLPPAPVRVRLLCTNAPKMLPVPLRDADTAVGDRYAQRRILS